MTGGDSADVDRDAPVLAADEILIHAPVAVVWALHIDVSGWTSWRHDVDRADLDGPFAVGSTFHWATGGLEIASTIREVQPHRRTVWGGPAAGIEGVHVWQFTPDDGRTRVRTTESWAGPAVEADTAQAKTMLAGHLAAWLADLKRAAETAQTPAAAETAEA